MNVPALIVALTLSLDVPSTDAATGVYAAVVDDVRRRLRGVGAVRVFVAGTTEVLTAAKLERLAADGPKDDPPHALELARRLDGYQELLTAGSTAARVPGGSSWSVVQDEPKLRCAGENWEMARDVFIRFSRPAIIVPARALVYAQIEDCISAGHDIIVLERKGTSWEIVMSYQIAGFGE